MNILVHTWVLSKYRGSEFSVTYNYVKEMSQFHHLYVLIESCSLTLEDLSEFSEYVIPNCDFIFIKQDGLSKLLQPLGTFPGYFRGWFKYLFYKHWEWQAYKYVRENLLNKIDLIHFLGPAGYHEPGYLWKLDKPYIWGPTSGFENVQSCLRKKYLKYKFITALKTKINNHEIKSNRRVRACMEKAQIVVAATSGNKQIIEKKFQTNTVLYFPENLMRISENEIIDINCIERKYSFGPTSKLNIIWCGTLTASKMPNMLLDILQNVQNKQLLHIDIVGGGVLQKYVENRVSELKTTGLEITLHGQIPREEVNNIFKNAHIHLLTSAYEANSTVMFEAMENCVPSIALNICGMADLVKDDNGFPITVETYDQCVMDIAKKLDMLTTSPSILLDKAYSLRLFSFNYSADKRVSFYNKIYKSCIGTL